MKYIIEHYFDDGWDILNKEDVYSTQAEAQKAIDDLITKSREEFALGVYAPEDFRVAVSPT